MHLLFRLNQRVRRDFHRWRYRHIVEPVLSTPPLPRGGQPFTLLSMVQPSDLASYLMALKSFARMANPQRVVIVCDPAMGKFEMNTLIAHVPHAELRHAGDFTHPKIPRGGTWERLNAIAAYASEDYVVQLDADTLTSGPVPEVLASIHGGSGFVAGEQAGQQCVSLAAAANHARPWLDDPGVPHIIAVAEVALPEVGLPAQARYVRGCSGFTGFPRAQDMRERLLDFSARMGDRIGLRWREWGSEQVASNYLLANSVRPTVLPFPRYATPDAADGTTVFWHFIGPVRFANGQYGRLSSMLLPALVGS
jgi:hypothetical protein